MSNRSLSRYACLLGIGLLAAEPADDFRISGPYTHDNLSIYLLHSARKLPAKHFLTLQEAMEQKKVVVYESGNVNELAIENLSAEQVYIQSGDIVKGGRQDRVFSDDVVLQSHSGKLPISSFCVEHGRWTKRGAEDSDRFSGNTKTVAGNQLKMAVRAKKNQQEVWNEVAKAQQSLAVASAAPVSSSASHGYAAARAFTPPATGSMQLAMEDKKIVEGTSAYVKDLAKILDGKQDVMGYAFAVNGKVSSADVYASPDLFRKMWPKLLDASAVEALSERPNNKATAAPDVAAVRATLGQAEKGRQQAQQQPGRLKVVKTESEKTLLWESREGDAWLHKSYIVK